MHTCLSLPCILPLDETVSIPGQLPCLAHQKPARGRAHSTCSVELAASELSLAKPAEVGDGHERAFGPLQGTSLVLVVNSHLPQFSSGNLGTREKPFEADADAQ